MQINMHFNFSRNTGIFLDICYMPCYISQNISRRFIMKRIMVFALLMMFATVSISAALESYQVTGPVIEVKDNTVTVQKGKENWQIAIDKDTKTTGDLKVGSKATIKYQMKATTIEVKDSGKKEEKKETKKK